MEDSIEVIAKGVEARNILKSDAFLDCFSTLRKQYTIDLVKSREEDAAGREKLYLKLRVLDELQSQLGIVEQNGIKAEDDVKTRRRRQNSI